MEEKNQDSSEFISKEYIEELIDSCIYKFQSMQKESSKNGDKINMGINGLIYLLKMIKNRILEYNYRDNINERREIEKMI